VPQRNVNREQLRPLLIACLETKSAQKWFDVLNAAGIPCGPINDVRGGIELATELGLEPVALAGDVPTVRHPLRFSQTPPRYDLPPPALDEHGEEIRAWLGQPAAHLRTLGAADSAPVPSA
jgi:crotonobetainyl-CoA:carnitine CoA-transferase CaiB-like acyl-CoA transferase